LRVGAVQPHVEGSGSAVAWPGRKGIRVETVSTGDEQSKLVAADGIATSDVVDPGLRRRSEFEEGSGEVGDVHRASHDIAEEHAGHGTDSQRAYVSLVLGSAVADDQRGPGDDGGRRDALDRGLGGGFWPHRTVSWDPAGTSRRSGPPHRRRRHRWIRARGARPPSPLPARRVWRRPLWSLSRTAGRRR
jgi:hypothetical protein